ncbi:MAG: hypothetical protein ACK4YP_15870 [Myxococcota bacterium]
MSAPSSPSRLLLALLLAGCAKDPVVEVLPGVNTDLEVRVVNPTDCPFCDPFDGVDTLRLEVSVGPDVVASDTFAYPGEAVTLPDLADFGVVRVTLLGLSDGRVFSAGRTAEIVLLPDAALSVPLVFVPANRALPLAAEMVTDRYRHVALPRRDGTVLLLGGLDPMRERATASTEVYDPATGVFTEFTALPTRGTAAPVVSPLPEGAALLSGGYAVIGENEVAAEDTVVVDDTSGVFVESGPLSAGRVGHCVAMFRARQGLALGGAEGPSDYLKPDPNTGLWGFSSFEMRDFDAGAVTGCAVLSDGVVYVQGADAASTGAWSADAEDPGQGFAPITEGTAGDFRYVRGAALLPSADGGMRILGGADVETGEVHADGRMYVPDARRFLPIDAFREPRFDPQVVPWIEDGVHVVGCGWADADRVETDGSVELVTEAGPSGPPLALDEERPGCALAVLPDGAILVTGGGEQGPPTGAAAALFVPYLDAAPGG